MKQTYGPTLFGQAAAELGRHPFPHPTGNLSQPYTNPLGAQLGACTYCGFCEKFGCGNYSKASPQTTVLPYLFNKSNFTLKTECEVLRVELTPDRKRATGVTYVNSAGEEFFQPAEMVILSAYVLQNVRLMLLSGIGVPYDPKTGEGVVGKNYAYQTMSSVNVFFDDKILNPFIGAGALATVIDDFNGDNFDHGGLGFIGGAYIAGMVTGGRPIEMIYTPEGTPRWGMQWKHAAAKNYLRSFSLSVHGSSMSARGNYLDLDPTYRDIHGRPMLRMTFDFSDNDHKMSDYLSERAAEVARAMKPREIKVNKRSGSWSVTPYQTTHNTGGAIMGSNPKDSVVNKFLQRRGQYLVAVGDCISCHLRPGGEPLAGGLGLKTPFGIIYSSNITPDRETGIGKFPAPWPQCRGSAARPNWPRAPDLGRYAHWSWPPAAYVVRDAELRVETLGRGDRRCHHVHPKQLGQRGTARKRCCYCRCTRASWT